MLRTLHPDAFSSRRPSFSLSLAAMPFFTNLLILLVTARILGELFERMKQPSMIGEILAGILLGPSLLNLIHQSEEIHVISELGIFLLVILAGLEINIDDILKTFRGRNLIISFLAFFLPIFGGIGVGFAFGLELLPALFVGLCVAITALPVSVRILMDLGKLDTELGKKIIAVAIFDDVLALTILGVLLNIQETDMSVLAVVKVASISLVKLILFITVLSLSYYVIRVITNKGNYIETSLNRLLKFLRGKEALFALFFAFVLLFSTITESLGFHFIIGAFFAAMLISDKVVGRKYFVAIEKTTSSLSMGFLAPIFFAGIGLEFQISAISNVWLLVAVVAVSFGSKIIGGYLGGLAAGMHGKIAYALGVGLNARGIMELVIANIAYSAGLISSEIFSILVIMGILTTLSTPMMLKRAFKRIEKPEALVEGEG